MKLVKRDPRKDPKVGDIVASEDKTAKRRVEKIRAGVVSYHDGSELKKCKLESWEHWCRTRPAIVIKRAA